MKTLSITLSFILLSLVSFAGRINALLGYASFYSPEKGPYIETYLSIDGKSVAYLKNAKGLYQAKVEVTLIFYQHDTIKAFQKYELNGPELADTMVLADFMYQERFKLANGAYLLEIQLLDKNKNDKPLRARDSVVIAYQLNKVAISGVSVLSSYKKTEIPNMFSKNGYDFMPYVSNFFPDNWNRLLFYSEIYNVDKMLGAGKKYLLSSYIEYFENNIIVDDLVNRKKETAKDVTILLNEFDIKNLPSGNYNLVIELKDSINNTIEKTKYFFQRSNKKASQLAKYTVADLKNSFITNVNSLDTMADFILCLAPISSYSERENALVAVQQKDITQMKLFFHSFWCTRDALQPQAKWYAYYQEVQKVNHTFGTKIKRGYETDRGRVYLQYGPPNVITDGPYDPSTVPYQIWQYYKLNGQSNRKFVFSNRDLATNDYELLHSDAMGEVSDLSWVYKIQKINTMITDPDQKYIDYDQGWGGRAKDLFQNPR